MAESMGEIMEFTATCLFGLEKFVADEIEALGYEKTGVIDGRVNFRGDISAVARCNIWLRYAERLYIKLGEFDAPSFDALFDGTRGLAWERWIGRDDMFPVKGHAIKSRLASVPDCQRIVKKAVAERLLGKHGAAALRETGVKYQVAFFILNDRASLMIDASGAPLHKRGYRTEAAEAPLRETLAAAMVRISRPREDVLLWDPFCGSGTVGIEAALLMSGTAPGIGRGFAAEEFGCADNIWRDARAEARDLQDLGIKFEAYASDIDKQCVDIARANIARAGMGGHVKAFVRDALGIAAGGRRGTIVCNPPYGERVSTREQAERLYRGMGEHFKTLGLWQVYILSALENLPELYGRRPDKMRRLYNGMIKCTYYQYFRPRGGLHDKN